MWRSAWPRHRPSRSPAWTGSLRQIESLSGKNAGWLDEPHAFAKPDGLVKFLSLAERAYLAAPAARKDMARALRDAMKQQPPKK